MNFKNNVCAGTVEFYSEKDRKEYTNFLLSRDESNIYHTIEWKEILEESYNIKPIYLISRDAKGKIRAILPLFYINSLLGKRLESLPLSIYGGVLGDQNYIFPLLETLFELKKEKKCSCVVLRQLPGYNQFFDSKNFRKIDNKWNQIIRLKNPDVLFKEIKKSNRNRIRKARQNKVEIKRVQSVEFVDDLYTLEVMIWRQIGLPIPELNFYKKIWDKLNRKGFAEIFIAKYNDEVIASTLIFPFNKRVVCRIANSNKKYRDIVPGVNNLLLWDAVVWSYYKGYEYFDLGATDRENLGLFFFKSTFTTYNYPFSLYYYPKNTIRVSEEVIFNLGKKVLQKTPIKIYEKMGPYLVKKFF
jgi:serine/alanine adding enzyme